MGSATGPTPSASSSRPASRAEDYRPGFGIYVHWPFCQSLCPYCDFNSHVRSHIDQRRWVAAYVAELTHYAARTAGRVVTSVFLGGGTPSLMVIETVDALLSAIRRLWPVADDIEVTLEANPNSVEADRFQGYRSAGVNRLSLGVQSLRDEDLGALGRQHSAADAIAAIETARGVFERYSIDLIYGRPGQTIEAWRSELAAAIDLAGGHLSAYQLTIEPGTVFFNAYRRGAFDMPDETAMAAFYETTESMLAAAGLKAYEVSNYARRGEDCRHNLTYWTYGDFVGVGPGAHGRLTIGETYAARQHRAPELWLERVENDGHATQQWTPLTHAAKRDELFMMGLRLARGVTRAAARARLQQDIEEAVSMPALRQLFDGGFVVLDDTGIRATRAGRQRLDGVLGRLLS